jgi:hypothetical protein
MCVIDMGSGGTIYQFHKDRFRHSEVVEGGGFISSRVIY